jgi:small subunit ribosomal protein S20
MSIAKGVFVAHSLSSKKRIRQNARRRVLNRGRTTALKTKLRKCEDALAHGQAQDAETAIRTAIKTLDREADRGTVHRNAAARRKSRLARRLTNVKKAAAPASA